MHHNRQTPVTARSKNLRFNAAAAATILITKFLILFFAFQAYQVLADKPTDGIQAYFNLWARWDAAHYLFIAENGYPAGGERGYVIAFFPFYPMLVAAFQTVFRNYVLSAFIVSGIASVLAAVFFRQLVRLDFSEKIAQNSVLFLCIFPTAYFLHIPYTESLFLMTVIGSFLSAGRGNFAIAGVLGFFACLTRINGIILFPALLFELREDYLQRGKIQRSSGWLLLIPAGFILYPAINYFLTGNALMFLEYQRQKWNKYLAFPFNDIGGKFSLIFNLNPAGSMMVAYQELFFVLLGLAAIIFGWRYLRKSYRVWMICNWLLFVGTSYILSVPRYTLTMFPLFILMALAAHKNRFLNIAFTVWSLFYLALFSALFSKGGWAF